MKSSGILMLLALILLTGHSIARETNESEYVCRDERVVTEKDVEPECNLLSIPAKEVADPYVFAASYFNYRMNIILRENIVSEYAYFDVPYYIYKSFMNADSKEFYWKNCIKDNFNYEIVY